MKIKVTNKKSRRLHGFILLEVILAAGIFAMAGIGFAVALNDMAKVFNRSRIEAEVRLELETRLNRLRLTPLSVNKLADKPDLRGVIYETEVSALEITNDEKFILTNLYKVTITAKWKEGAEEQLEKAELYVYQP